MNQHHDYTRKNKENAILIDKQLLPHMKRVEEVLNIELFPRKTGLISKIGGSMEPKVLR